MSIETYDVYFSGACLKTADPTEVKRKVGAMFKLEGEKLERLFSGKPIPIKRGVDMDQAVKFRVAFRDAGGLVDIVPEGQPAPSPSPTPAARSSPAPNTAPSETTTDPAPKASPDSSDLTLAEGPLPVEETVVSPVVAPDYGLSAPQDFNLSDCAPEVEAATIPDISELDLDKPGVTLDETPAYEPLEIDTEALELDESGTVLTEEMPVDEPDINIDALSMSEPKQGSLEDCQQPVEPAPLPNIDHLHLDEEAREKRPQGKAKFEIAED
ncbi:MAG: hypothetical protein KZQ93_16905 [Candidatus Thiodiazotropha sp. (ex Monitilora ramsayi)]|nr:hypothetical protein [Candidatus Thiodiazotropha sp. (ex Monitilora ramsayi)]